MTIPEATRKLQQERGVDLGYYSIRNRVIALGLGEKVGAYTVLSDDDFEQLAEALEREREPIEA